MTDRTVKTYLKGDVSDYNRALLSAAATTKAFTRELNTSTDRSTMLTQSLLAIGPALVPISAAAIPAISGLTNQMGFAVAGAGAMVLAFSGVGDALKATNDYAIEPTEANLEKMRQSMSEIAPAGEEFVYFLQGLRDQLQGLQDASQIGMFPGLESGIKSALTRLPQVERITFQVSRAIGDLMSEAGANLADPRWDEFFTFLETEARPVLIDFGRTLGNLGEGFANLWMAFDPLSDTFSKGFLQMARDFAAWTDGLDQTQGFQEFVEYIQRVGPKAWDTLGALGNALLQIVEAAAPVGEAALPIIEALADGLAAIANSDAGPALITAAAGISAISRAVGLYNAANGSAIGKLLDGSIYGGTATKLRGVSAAATELQLAQDALAKSAAHAKDSQGAFIPAPEKRRALADWSKSARDYAQAEKGMVAAQKARVRQMGAVGAGAAGLTLVMSDLDEKVGLSNTAMGTMAGTMFGPWGAAVGGSVGLALDFASANDDVWAAVDRANQALGQGPANLEMQAAAIAEVRTQIDDLKEATDVGKWELPSLGDFMKKSKNDIEGLFGSSDTEEAAAALAEMEEQYAENERAAQDLKFAEAGLGASMDDASASARVQKEAMIDLRNEHNAAAEAALANRDAERGYEEAIDKAAESLEKNGRTLDINTEAGRANLAANDQIIASFNKMDYATQQSSGGMAAAREAFVKATVAAGGSAEAARTLATELLQVKSPPPIDIKTRDLSSDVIASIQAARDRLKDKTITMTVKRIELIERGKLSDRGNEARAPRATGGEIVGPGTGTSDDIPAWLSNGEHVLTADEVIKAGGQGAVYRMRAAIRAGTMPAFATGGAVTKLDIKEQQARVRDIQRELDERETVKRNGKKVRVHVLRRGSLDREIAELQLKEAKKELWHLRNRTGAKADAREAADETREKAREVIRDTKASVVSNFKIGSLSSAAAVERSLSNMLADSATFLGLLGSLKKKGASPWLLSQLVEAGPTKGAIRLATQYNTDQAALNSINAQARQIDQFGNAYAGLVGNSRFTMPAPWNSGVSPASAAPAAGAQVQIDVHPSEGMSETALANAVGGQLAWRMT